MDVLVPTTMKNAVKCDTSCESQNPVSHQNFERSLRFLGSMSVGVSVHLTSQMWWRLPISIENVCRWKISNESLLRVVLIQTTVWIGHDVITTAWQTIKLEFTRSEFVSFGPPISQEYPLNLSILLGGGKETNKDSLSNGE